MVSCRKKTGLKVKKMSYMKDQIKAYLSKYPNEMIDMYVKLRAIICDSTSHKIEETLWAKIPSFYVGDAFVRLIVFKDHMNIEANAMIHYKDELKDYKLTPKGMLQLYLEDHIPNHILKKVFAETFA